jgi:hypothetical protein
MVCLLLLTLKDYLHRLARRVELEDVEATLKFAVISVIILPLLRNEVFGPPPLNVINPYKIWLNGCPDRGVEFFGLRAGQSTWERARAPRDGDPRRPGIEPSTAVTLSFSQRSRQEPAMSSAFVLAICHRRALEHTGQGGHGSVSGIPPLRRTLLLATFLVLIAAIVGAVIVGRASRFVLIRLTECGERARRGEGLRLDFRLGCSSICQVDFSLGVGRILSDGPFISESDPTLRMLGYLCALRHWLPDRNEWRARRRTRAGQARVDNLDRNSAVAGI